MLPAMVEEQLLQQIRLTALLTCGRHLKKFFELRGDSEADRNCLFSCHLHMLFCIEEHHT